MGLDEETAESGAVSGHRGSVWAPGHRQLTAGLVLTVTLVALESLSVATILPVVSRQLGDLRLYGWVFSAFFLANLVGTVVAGDLADRRGLRRSLLGGLVLFGVGLAIGGTALDMPVLVVGRVVQGFGAGAVAAIAYVTVGRSYPNRDRPRMLAVLSTAWVVPGLIGPVLSALVATAFGWRWVFLGLIPLVGAAATLVAPALRAVPAPARADTARATATTTARATATATARTTTTATTTATTATATARLPIVPALGAAGGAGAILAGLTIARPLPTLALVVVGLAVAIPALTRLTPKGTLRARSGLPVTVLSRGLLTFAFFSGDAYVPFLLTTVRHQPTTFAGLTLTVGTMTWTVAAWIQERTVHHWGPRRLIAAGQATVVLALGGLALCLLPEVPAWVTVVAWGLGGFGMGLAYASVSLTALDRAPAGRQGWATSAVQLNDVLGTALGAGVAGAAVAFGQRHGQVRPGLACALAVAAVVGLLGLAVSHRVPATLLGATGTGGG
jgi:MFS family permease